MTLYSYHVNLELLPFSLSASIGMTQLSPMRKMNFGPLTSTDCVRFVTPVSKEEFCDVANGVVPLNTEKNLGHSKLLALG